MCAYRLKQHFSAWRHCQESTNDESAVLSSVSSFTRVCAYDRPGTRIDGKDIFNAIPQPHPVDHDPR
jgi:hypothetical protein